MEKQWADQRTDVALVRLEQIHPLPMDQLFALRERYAPAPWTWVQEAPGNKGALSFLKMNLTDNFALRFVRRPASAASATGFSKMHGQEQAQILEQAFRD